MPLAGWTSTTTTAPKQTPAVFYLSDLTLDKPKTLRPINDPMIVDTDIGFVHFALLNPYTDQDLTVKYTRRL